MESYSIQSFASVFAVHPYYGMWEYFIPFLLLNSILLYEMNISHFVTLLTSC